MTYDNAGDASILNALVALYAIFIVVYILVFIAYYVVMALALMKFFAKVGVEPWIAWVPVYNNWKWLEVGGQQGWFALLVFVPLGNYVYFVFHCIAMYRIDKAFLRDGAWVVLGIFLPFVWAFMLGSRNEVYRPEMYADYGWPPPLAGFGSSTRDGF